MALSVPAVGTNMVDVAATFELRKYMSDLEDECGEAKIKLMLEKMERWAKVVADETVDTTDSKPLNPSRPHR